MLSKWIAHSRISEENEINLICFTYPGGSASNFATWKKLIDSKINLVPILYPERELRKKDTMQENIDIFVQELVEENKEIFSGKYAFFGYCGGAILAYEACLKAKELYNSEPVYGLIASSEEPKFLGDSLVVFPEELGDAKEDIVAHLSSLGIFDESVLRNDTFLSYYLPMLKADCRLLDTYKPKEYVKLNCDLDVLYGTQDTTVKKEKVVGWSDTTNGATRVEGVDAGHFFVDPMKEYVCDIINNNLLDLSQEGEVLVEEIW